jgi:predicted Zn finger-like uncharacterized protein
MKFLCDRCKTRYSIADERVRGKILKIRCKNCANVISVREGMTDADDAPAPAAQGSALQSAFANVMVGTRPGETQPPPPVLEEEWYVAIDGNQSGPFTLAEAQAWVGAKPALDDLYCWCEGFDDWLPVEKVSHFRGLRAPRSKTPTASRPAARDGSAAKAMPAPAPAPAAPPVEDEPKPLFAATLAKLEAETPRKEPAKEAPAKDASKSAPKVPETISKPAPIDRSKPAEKAPASLTPLGPVSPRAPLPMPTRNAPLPSPSVSRGAQAAVAAAPVLAPEPSEPLTAKKPELPSIKPQAAPAPLPAKPAGGAKRPMFDTGDPDPEPESLDQGDLEDDDDAAAPRAPSDMDLEIGEVSRVVRLPDLMAAARPAPRSGQRAAMRAQQSGQQPIARGTGAAPAIAAAAGAAALGGAVAVGPDGAPLPPLSDSALADAQPQLQPSVHRRNPQAMWMIGGAVLVLGIIIVVAVAASGGGSGGGDVSTGNLDVTGLGYSYDPLRPHGAGSDDGAGTGSVSITGVHVIKRNTGGGNNGSQQIATNQGTGRQEIGPNGEPILPLTGDDIIQVSQKNSMGTGRCYDRALKKDPFLQVAKINVSLKVDVNGVVTEVQLDSHASDDLGQCLTAAIRRWGFRKSTEGITTVFPLVFQQGP